jgi:drug/metabolite transporter (DMT)-like permease
MLLMVTFVALWTLVELIAASLLTTYTAYQVVWTRYAVHLVLMLALWGWREPRSLVRTGRPGFQLARSALMLVMPISWFVGTQAGVPMGTTMAVFWFSPLMILVAAMLFLGERASPLAWGVCTLATAGALALFAPRPLPEPWLLVAPLAMGLSFALYVVMTRSLRGEPLRANLFYTAFGVFALLTPVLPFVWVTPSSGDLARLIVVGVLGYFTLLALDRMAAAAPLTVATPLIFLQLSLTVALGLVLGHLPADRRSAVALALVSVPAIMFWAHAPQRRIQESA